MSRYHLCTEGQWEDGGVDSCDKHGPRNRKPMSTLSKGDRAKLDKQAGVVGKDDGYGSYRGT